MKRVVDIPEEMFEAIKEGCWSGSHELELAIRNSTPYEEKAQGDSISREALKKCAIPCEIHNGAMTDLCVPLYQIDNAPAVEPEKVYLAKFSFDEEQLQEIVDKAKAEVLSSVEQDEIVIRSAFKNYARKVMYEKNVTNFSLLKVFDEIIDNAPIQRGEEE